MTRSRRPWRSLRRLVAIAGLLGPILIHVVHSLTIPAISALMLRLGFHSPLARLLWEVAFAGSLALSIVMLLKTLRRRIIILKI